MHTQQNKATSEAQQTTPHNNTSQNTKTSTIQTKQGKKPTIQAKGFGGRSLQPIQTKQAEKPAIQAKGFGGNTLQPIQRQATGENTGGGLPNTLKTNMERMSGTDLSDVKVHYNSDKPAQLQAHAYAQGSDIHLGTGQEKHLPHEAWHVVQQKQGRVQATTQMKGEGGSVGVNDSPALEREADQMGAKAVQRKAKEEPTQLKKGKKKKGTAQLKENKKKKGTTQLKVVQRQGNKDPELEDLQREARDAVNMYLERLKVFQLQNWKNYSLALDKFTSAVKASSAQTLEKILVNNVGSELVEMIQYKGVPVGEFVEVGVDIQRDIQTSKNITAETDVRLKYLNNLIVHQDKQRDAYAKLAQRMYNVELMKIWHNKEHLRNYANNLSIICRAMHLKEHTVITNVDEVTTKLLSEYLQKSGHSIVQYCAVERGYMGGHKLLKNEPRRTYLVENTNILEDLYIMTTGNEFEDEAITQALIQHAKWPANRAVQTSFIKALMPNIPIHYKMSAKYFKK